MKKSYSTPENFSKLSTTPSKAIRLFLMVFAVCLFSNTIVTAQISTLNAWSNAYHGTSTSQETVTYAVSSGSGINRILVVAIASSQTSGGARTVVLSYGGQSLTSVKGDMATTTVRQHTQLYYLNEAGLDAATNTNLLITVSGGTTRITDVFAAVYDGVDQTSPITNSQTYSSGTSTTSTLVFGTALNVNAYDKAIEIVSSMRTGSTNTRTFTYATNWSLDNSAEQTYTTTDAVRNAIATRSVPNTNSTDTSSTTLSNSSLASMTGMSLKAAPPTITSLGSSSGCVGSSITINGTNLLGAGTTAANVKIGGTAVASVSSNSGTQIVAVLGSGTTGTVSVASYGTTVTTTDTFTVNATPTTANAGTDQTNCNNSAFTLSGNTPTVGTGSWSVVTGTATITSPSSRNSGVTGITAGTSATLRWTISNGSCTESTNDVVLTNAAAPTTANAGVDINNNDTTTFTLAGNSPTIGTGIWSVVSGTATITTPSSRNSGVTGIAAGSSATLRWTISNGTCTASTDDVVLTNYSPLIISFNQGSLMSDITIDPCGAIGGGAQQDIDIDSGGVSGATYQWQYSLVNSPSHSWQTENENATSTQSQYVISSFGSVAGDYYFRLIMTVNGFSITSDIVHLKVNATSSTLTSAGTIGDDQNTCSNSLSPSTFTEKTAPIGTAGSFTYQWQSSTDNVNFTDIDGEDSSTYNAPSVSITTYFRRKVTSGCSSLYTNTITVTIGSPVTTGVTICAGGSGVLTSAIVPMDATLTTSGTDAGTGTGTGWTTPENISTTNNATISIAKGGTSNRLSATNYGFSIPSNATIKGVQVAIRRLSSNSSSLQDNAVNLIVGGNVVGNNNGATSTNWPTTIGTANYGSTTDLWGATLTPAIINDSNFGVSLVVDNVSTNNSPRTASVDYMQIRVTYFLPGTIDWFTAASGGTKIGLGNSFNPVGVANSGLANTNTAGTTSYYAECSSSPDCRTKTDFVINATLAGPSHSVTQPTLALATGSVTLTGLPASGTISYAGTIGLAITGTTQTISGLVPETYSFTISNGTSPCTFTITGVIIKPQPKITVGTITNPIKCGSKGSVVLSGLPETGTWTINPGAISGTGTTTTVSGLAGGTYNFTVTTISGGTSSASSDVVIEPLATRVFENGIWKNGAPTADENINLISGTITTDITACSCKVLTNSSVVVQSGKTVTLTNEITVQPNGYITFEDTASLVQINDVENSGHITYKRTTSVLANNYDFVYWSSPVKDQKLGTIWMGSSRADTFYNFNPTVGNWARNAAADEMEVGKGYITRARSGQSGLDYNGVSSTWTAGGRWTTKFHGVPNNGTITSSDVVGGKFCLLGNPYPSALDANAFLSENSAILDGTIYFWTHNTPINNNAYVSNDYAAYNINLEGGVATQYGANNIPTGNIAAGQGFFAKAKTSVSGTVTYKNTMRVASAVVNNITSNGNHQFFKTTANQKTESISEKNRIWLNLTNSQGLFKQTLVGYVNGATNAFEKTFDGESMNGNAYADFYSFTENKKLTIQGRALPFDTNDSVPLGFKTTINGDFKISIAQVDGLFTNQAVYIEDKLTNTVFNLKSGDYTFTTVAGTFNDRFVLTYVNNADGTDSTKGNQVLVSTKNKEIKINSATGTIDKVLVYDLLGRVVYEKNNVSSTEFTILNLETANQNLVVKAILENGATVTNKIIF
jgi:hypothetical protein